MMDSPAGRFFLGALMFVAMFAWGIMTGTPFGRGTGMFSRSESPNMFWAIQNLYALAAIGFAALAIWELLKPAPLI